MKHLFVLFFILNSCHSGSFTNLPIPQKNQHMDSWCWAAVAAMSYEYINDVKIKDCEVATIYYEKGLNCCSYDNKCDYGLKMSHFKYLLKEQLKMNIKSFFSSISFKDIMNNINKGNIIIVSTIEKITGLPNHVSIITGYLSSTKKLTINDPTFGKVIINYDDFVSGKNNIGLWGFTIVIKKK